MKKIEPFPLVSVTVLIILYFPRTVLLLLVPDFICELDGAFALSVTERLLTKTDVILFLLAAKLAGAFPTLSYNTAYILLWARKVMEKVAL